VKVPGAARPGVHRVPVLAAIVRMHGPNEGMNVPPHRRAALRAIALTPFACALALHCAFPLAQPAPELPSGWTPKSIVRKPIDMVAAANPLAVAAGVTILGAGGSAVDAAIAVQMVLNLVEPQSSGIGGGALMLTFSAASGAVEMYDGRETAPAAATGDLFVGASGQPLGFFAAVIGGRSVGTPGVLRMLQLAHKEQGRLPWSSLFEPAIELATNGFAVSPRLYSALRGAHAALRTDPTTRDYFYNADGTPKAVGTILRNPDLAATLRTIAADGADAFYGGPIARDIVAKVRSHPTNPGALALSDLADYRAKKRDPLCGAYRSRWVVCGTAMPSSGGPTVLMTLRMLEGFDVAALRPNSPEAVHLVAEALRLAYADRAVYMADADFVCVPVAGLVDPDYLRARASRISVVRSMGTPTPGVPAGCGNDRPAAQKVDHENGTSHLAIVDRDGNAVAMTTTIENAFGSYQMVRGFLLNNELTDFSFEPKDAAGAPVANRVEPGKRPRSSMAPTIVFDDRGRLYAVLGSPGGSNIVEYVVKTLLGILDWNLDVQQAIDLPNFGAQTSAVTTLEKGSAIQDLGPALRALGHTVRLTDSNSGLHAIVRERPRSTTVDGREEEGAAAGGYAGGADPRREGTANGH
jgi:gamma-glutamyltranspeptidase/glutathione hydrolase